MHCLNYISFLVFDVFVLHLCYTVFVSALRNENLRACLLLYLHTFIAA